MRHAPPPPPPSLAISNFAARSMENQWSFGCWVQMGGGEGRGEWGRGCGRCMRRKVYVGMGSHFGRFVSNKILVYVWKIGGIGSRRRRFGEFK